ncbi:reverse transcriptase domain-containing protein [Tanacetum coccineum]
MGRNLKAYVDDMVIKSKTELDMIKDIKETLLTLKNVNMKLNPKKFSFGMEEGKFLGYIVTSERIRANPEKTKVVMNMPSPSSLKQMKRLSGKLTALNRFLSKAAKKVLPCLDALKKYANKKDFHMNSSRAANKVSIVPYCYLESKLEGTVPIYYVNKAFKVPSAPLDKTNLWKLYTDGASNDHGSGAGLILIDPEGTEYSYAIRLNFTNSNNDAEYEALLAGLRIAVRMKVEKIHAFVD